MNVLVALLFFVVIVAGNTEIVNFAADSVRYQPVPGLIEEFAALDAQQNMQNFTVLPQPRGSSPDTVNGKLWFQLNLDGGWSEYSAFTLRISWPASYPAAFFIDLFGPTTDVRRVKFASISVIDTGILTPHPHLNASHYPRPVPFDVVLEPLYFDVLPASIIPLVLFVIFLVPILIFAAQRVHGYLRTIALHARKDMILHSRTKQR